MVGGLNNPMRVQGKTPKDGVIGGRGVDHNDGDINGHDLQFFAQIYWLSDVSYRVNGG